LDIANIRLGLIVPRGIPYTGEPNVQTEVAPQGMKQMESRGQ